MRYTFLSNRGDYVTVETDDDAEARPLAMQALYGDCPVEWVEWEGLGLHLTKEEE